VRTAKKRRSRVSKISDAPMAVASDGTVLLNLTHLENGDALAAARKLLDGGHEVFVGVAVPARLRRELLQGIDDGAADLVGRLGAQIRRAKARR